MDLNTGFPYLVTARILFFAMRIKLVPEAQPSSYMIGAVDCFLGNKSARARS
jgi:hypothetical protein